MTRAQYLQLKTDLLLISALSEAMDLDGYLKSPEQDESADGARARLLAEALRRCRPEMPSAAPQLGRVRIEKRS